MMSVFIMQFRPHVISGRKIGGIEGGGQVSAQGAMHMAAALAGCKKPWSAPVWPFLSLTQTGADKAPLPL